jgi:hypothetical protein
MAGVPRNLARAGFVLDGHAIADEYWMTRLSGQRIVLGTNFHTYKTAGRFGTPGGSTPWLEPGPTSTRARGWSLQASILFINILR